MEDFAFAMPLTRPDAPGTWFQIGACFGVFDGHGGHEVAQSLVETVPTQIQDDVHRIARAGPEHVGQILRGHERRLRRRSVVWGSGSGVLSTTVSPREGRTVPLRASSPAVPGFHASMSQQLMTQHSDSPRLEEGAGPLRRESLSMSALGGDARAARDRLRVLMDSSGSDTPPRRLSPSPGPRPPRPPASAVSGVAYSMYGHHHAHHSQPQPASLLDTYHSLPHVPYHTRAGLPGEPLDSPSQASHPHTTVLETQETWPGGSGSHGAGILAPDQPLPAVLQPLGISDNFSFPSVSVRPGAPRTGSLPAPGTQDAAISRTPTLAAQLTPLEVMPGVDEPPCAPPCTEPVVEPLLPPLERLTSSPVPLDGPRGQRRLGGQRGVDAPLPTAADTYGPPMLLDSFLPITPPVLVPHQHRQGEVVLLEGEVEAAGASTDPLLPPLPLRPSDDRNGDKNGHAWLPRGEASPWDAPDVQLGASASPDQPFLPHTPGLGGHMEPLCGAPEELDDEGDAPWTAAQLEEWEAAMCGRDPGSTALVATIIDDCMHVANVGDCRLLLAELAPAEGRVVARPVTVDHVPRLHKGEAERLAALSIPVSTDGYVGPEGGYLQVSRSIGDFSTKTRLGEAVILSDPELHTVRLGPNVLFAVAASDGITCAMSDETIVNQVCKYLNEDGPGGGGVDPQHAAEQLVRYAIDAANSSDNAAVVVSVFTHAKPPLPPRPRLFASRAMASLRRESGPTITGLKG